MARSVFFSFHWADVWRANRIRNSWVTHEGRANSFYDRSIWEEARTKGDAAIKRLIDSGMVGCSVTAVLIGKQTASRKYVRYEIEQSIKRGMGLLGVFMHEMKDQNKRTDWLRGNNPFDYFNEDGSPRQPSLTVIELFLDKEPLSEAVDTYDWVSDNGYEDFPEWVEDAATMAGR